VKKLVRCGQSGESGEKQFIPGDRCEPDASPTCPTSCRDAYFGRLGVCLNKAPLSFANCGPQRLSSRKRNYLPAGFAACSDEAGDAPDTPA
jgi:hypothetical protein